MNLVCVSRRVPRQEAQLAAEKVQQVKLETALEAGRLKHELSVAPRII